MKQPACVILAAGQGTRMKSRTPKMLHTLLGKPMIAHVVETALSLRASPVAVVVGHGRDEVQAGLSTRFPGRLSFVVQERQEGTAHAVRQALPALKRHAGDVFILYGDVPLASTTLLKRLRLEKHRAKASIAFLSMEPPQPGLYGRVLRNLRGRVLAIREARDCTKTEIETREVNSGLYCVDAAFLRRHLGRVGKRNAKREFYLTDLVAIAAAKNQAVAVRGRAEDLEGINNRLQLAAMEEVLAQRIRERLMLAGVTIRMPDTVLVEDGVRVAADVDIEPGASLRGSTVIGRGSVIGQGSIISDSRIASGVTVKPYSILEGAIVETGAVVGPFARLRPGTVLGKRARVGNFVECKKTVMGKGSKANHLSYLGDGVIGKDVNVGAGTIFCNYDGFSKHTTVLEDDVFIGSDTQIVAPLTVGRGSYVATGTTLTRDVPPESVAMSRVRQETREGYAPLLKDRLRDK